MPLGREVGLGPGHIVLDGNQLKLPSKKGNSPPNFWPCLLWPNSWMDPDATWYEGRPRPRPHCIRWETSNSPKGKPPPPQFSAHVCCGQTAGLIKMPLGREVGLGPGHIVLDGDQLKLPSKRGTALPIFGPCLLWPNSWMGQDATWYGGRPRPKQHFVR